MERMTGTNSTRARARGFTIIELMIVMLLIGVFLGLGAGVYLGLGDTLRYRTAVGRVKTVIRKTRNFAVSGGGPAVVTLDPKARIVRGSGNLPVGLWHFEDDTGAFGRPASVEGGGAIGPGGRFGRGVVFAERGWIDLGRSREYDDREGVAIELWVRVPAVEKLALVEKGDAYRLGTDTTGRLEGAIEVEPGREVAITAEGDDPLPVDRWVRVGLEYDRRELRLVRDGRRVAAVAESEPLRSDASASLTIGTTRSPIAGRVDEARIYRMVPGEGVELPEGMTLEAAEPIEIVYRRGGSLDPEVHPGPVTLRFRLPEGEETVVIGALGMIL